MLWRIKILPKRNEAFLLYSCIIYWFLATTLYFYCKKSLQIIFNLKHSYDSIIVISTIIFAFYTTSYFTTFSGKIGRKLKASYSFYKIKKLMI